MGRKQDSRSQSKAHPQLGGDWTQQKLDVLSGYLKRYTIALKNRPFTKWYIDAFAGTGYRDVRDESKGASSSEAMFPEFATETQYLLDGSARLALKVEPRFDRYVFIESNSERCAQLDALRLEFPDLAAVIDIRQGDANAKIGELCRKDWRAHRAVMFLDPFGMQVEWKTLEAIADTKAIDLWILFPLGVAVNRLLTKSGDIPGPWRRRLTLMFGTDEWYDAFYKARSTPTLFGEDRTQLVKATQDSIGKYFNDRLQTIFSGVASTPGVLRNSKNNPLYLLCFAVGNERGTAIALRIANHLLRGLS